MQPCDPNLTPVAACLSKLFISLPAFLSVLHCASNKAARKTSPLQQNHKNWLELLLSVSVWLNFKGEDPIKRCFYHSTYEQWRSEVWWSRLTDCDSRLCVADVFLFYLNYWALIKSHSWPLKSPSRPLYYCTVVAYSVIHNYTSISALRGFKSTIYRCEENKIIAQQIALSFGCMFHPFTTLLNIWPWRACSAPPPLTPWARWHLMTPEPSAVILHPCMMSSSNSTTPSPWSCPTTRYSPPEHTLHTSS